VNNLVDPINPPPDTEVEAIPIPTPPNTSAEITFQGNNYDLMSVVGVTTGGIALLTLGTCGLGTYCLPFLPILLGVIGLVVAKDSIDPDRTKRFSWISIGAGGILFALIIMFVALYIGIIFFAVAAEGGSF